MNKIKVTYRNDITATGDVFVSKNGKITRGIPLAELKRRLGH